MKVKFEYNGHDIVLCRELLSVKLIIDGVECDKVDGIIKSQFSSFELHGKIDEKNICLKVKLGAVLDKAELYINDDMLETKRIP